MFSELLLESDSAPARSQPRAFHGGVACLHRRGGKSFKKRGFFLSVKRGFFFSFDHVVSAGHVFIKVCLSKFVSLFFFVSKPGL